MGPELGYGIGIHTEPRYNLTDNLSISSRGDINIFDNQATNESLKLGFFSSAVLLGDYYFKNDKNSRVFTGLGFGYFTEDNQSLGIVPRIGYEFLIFRLTADYNYTFNEFTSE